METFWFSVYSRFQAEKESRIGSAKGGHGKTNSRAGKSTPKIGSAYQNRNPIEKRP
jgi:hypothetical protein